MGYTCIQFMFAKKTFLHPDPRNLQKFSPSKLSCYTCVYSTIILFVHFLTLASIPKVLFTIYFILVKNQLNQLWNDRGGDGSAKKYMHKQDDRAGMTTTSRHL